MHSADQIAHPRQVLDVEGMALGGVAPSEALGTFTSALDLRGGLPGIELPPMARPTFNFGYGHTLPREVRNLAVLGPAGGFGGLGEGAGRIMELNISVGPGLAIAGAQALQAHGASRGSQPEVDPRLVAARMPARIPPYGRPTGGTLWEVCCAGSATCWIRSPFPAESTRRTVRAGGSDCAEADGRTRRRLPDGRASETAGTSPRKDGTG